MRKIRRFFKKHGDYMMLLTSIACILFLVGFFNTVAKQYFAVKRVDAAEEMTIETEKSEHDIDDILKTFPIHTQTYVVKAGDSFYSIAEKYIERFDLIIDPTTLAKKIQIQNNFTDSEFHLQPGLRLHIDF